MRKSKIAVCFMTALLLSVAAVSELIQREHFPFSVTIAGTETIDCWRKDGCYYVFLPGYTDGSQAKLVTNPLFPVSIDGQKVGKDTVCADFPLGRRLPIVYSKWRRSCSASREIFPPCTSTPPPAPWTISIKKKGMPNPVSCGCIGMTARWTATPKSAPSTAGETPPGHQKRNLTVWS